MAQGWHFVIWMYSLYSSKTFLVFLGKCTDNPLVAKKNGVYYFVGIISHGKVSGCYGKPTIFTKIEPYIPWLKSNMKPWIKRHNECNYS